MRAIPLLLTSILVLLLAEPLAAADPLPQGTSWTGIFKRFGKKDSEGRRISSTDAEFKITHRDGDNFKAELWLGDHKKPNDRNGLRLEGTVSPTGGIKCTPTKVLKGDWANDIIGRAQVVGSVRNGGLRLRYTLPGNRRFGEVELKEKT